MRRNDEKILRTEMHIPTIFKMTCDEPWFSFIRNGVKPVEGRKNSPKYQKIQVGDLIDFSNGTESFLAIVVEIKQYPLLEDYLKDVTFQKALPGVSSFEEAVNLIINGVRPRKFKNMDS
jgi:ASC-1-like (ASCH) protein